MPTAVFRSKVPFEHCPDTLCPSRFRGDNPTSPAVLEHVFRTPTSPTFSWLGQLSLNWFCLTLVGTSLKTTIGSLDAKRWCSVGMGLSPLSPVHGLPPLRPPCLVSPLRLSPIPPLVPPHSLSWITSGLAILAKPSAKIPQEG